LVDAYKRCRYYLDDAISRVKPGATTAEVAAAFPKAEEFGFANEEDAFALQLGHGVGLSIWEKPVMSRLVIDYPEVIQEGMVFALETYWPSSDGYGAARIEEQMVVTKDGCELMTRFPAEDLMVAGGTYYTVGGPLPRTREMQSNLNRDGYSPNGSSVQSEESSFATTQR
jgi:Xaa-Pro aminopeptidase